MYFIFVLSIFFSSCQVSYVSGSETNSTITACHFSKKILNTFFLLNKLF
ncbi:hypothetical protein GLYMA_11G189050v4 [Glycine max]|nr:hypothetical protein GLYMA_11G189050v4 [Glycine max]KAH1159287.1 hypothetical protein GYH30_031152 [Glycine max]